MSWLSSSDPLDKIQWKMIRYTGKLAKKESKPFVKYLKSQIKKRKTKGTRGDPPRKITGRVRRFIQARDKFRNRRTPGGGLVLLKIKSWTPISNILFSPASGKKIQETKMAF